MAADRTPYTKLVWVNEETKLNESNHNHIEQGIFNAMELALENANLFDELIKALVTDLDILYDAENNRFTFKIGVASGEYGETPTFYAIRHVIIDTHTTDIYNHISNTSNPHNVSKAQVGLGNVDNTADVDKPVSTEQQAALDLKANVADVYDITDADATFPKKTALADPEVIHNMWTFDLVPQTAEGRTFSNSERNFVDVEYLLYKFGDLDGKTVKGYSDTNLAAAKTYADAKDVEVKSYVAAHYINQNQLGLALGVATLDEHGKLIYAQIPDILLGQMMYGGTVSGSGLASLSTNAKKKLNVNSNTLQLSNDTTETSGYESNEGLFYLLTGSGSFAGLDLQVGDWLVSDADGWTKIDNTDAVTGVKGAAESVYRIGNVNITPENIGLGNVDDVKQYPYTSGTALETNKLDKSEASDTYQPKVLHVDLTSIQINDWVLDTSVTPNLWKYESANVYNVLGVVNTNDLLDVTGIDYASGDAISNYDIHVKDIVTETAVLNDYDENENYGAGDYCMNDDVLYVCTAATTGAWDSTKWNQIDGITTVILYAKFKPEEVLNLSASVTKQHTSGGHVDDLLTTADFDNKSIVLRDSKLQVNPNILNMFAPDYNNQSLYTVGQVVMHDGTLYTCQTAVSVAEDFDSSKWEVTHVNELLERYTETIPHYAILEIAASDWTLNNVTNKYECSIASGLDLSGNNTHVKLEGTDFYNESLFGTFGISPTSYDDETGYINLSAVWEPTETVVVKVKVERIY